ncbi:MAG TPA: hypothetical protein VLL03_01740 [Burkholderiales bacterium]|nr:hypothetical protein [Burkholderiales bacterium]
MAKPDNLLSKMDALMKKHRAPDNEIPTLTDVIATAAKPGPGQTGLAALTPEQVETLAIQIYQRVLQNLDEHINNELQLHLKPQLNILFGHVLDGMLAELKNSIKAVVDDAVAQALDAQLKHHQKLDQSSAPTTKRFSGDKP